MRGAEPDLRGFSGRILRRGEPDWELHRYQYAYTSVDGERSLAPALILAPRSTEDVLCALNFAERRDVAVALRTGGHQLSGASSTRGDNILLDLRHTWPHFEWHREEGLVEAGVSQDLSTFNARLGGLGLFLPHGQCSHVGLGGHIQTGGSGMLARAFGLMSDHVERFEIITADGRVRMVRRGASDPEEADLYWAVLGGSPGNFGLVTRAFFRPLRDEDHPGSRGLKFMVPYSRARLEALLELVSELAGDDELAADHDLTVTVLGAPQLDLPRPLRVTNSRARDQLMRVRHPEVYGRDGHRALPRAIVVYGQWSNLGGRGQVFDASIFERLRRAAGYGFSSGRSIVGALAGGLLEAIENRMRLDGSPLGLSGKRPTPISELTRAWMFLNVREFGLPYVKRVYLSDREDLSATGWARAAAERFDELVRRGGGMKGLLQVQAQGGRHSRFRSLHAGDPSAHSWRNDTSAVCLVDCFHPDEGAGETPAREWAEAWQRENDRVFLGERRFATADRRFWWGSYGDTDMERVWPHYVESAERYERLRRIKARVDPRGRFTPNAFGIASAPAE